MEVRNCVMTDQYKRIQGAKLKLQNKTVSVYKGVNTVGRNRTAIINLKNVNVSQHHAIIIIVDETQHFISDLNSSNGTYLHDTRLAPFKLYELSNDTEIKFGDEVVSYLKMPNFSATMYLETEPLEMTQNVSQNIYAASTQLMFDNLSLNQTNLSSAHHERIPNRDTQDIHEAATQVVVYPSKVKGANAQDNVLIETVSDDIHEAATQVFALTPQPSTSKAAITSTSRSSKIQKHVEDIHEIATQVMSFPSDKNEERIAGKTITPCESNKGIFNPDDFFMNDQTHADPSVIEDSLVEITVMAEGGGNAAAVYNEVVANGDSNDSTDFLFLEESHNAEPTPFSDNANVTEDKKSTASDSQTVGQARKRPARKLSSSEEPSGNRNKACNSDSDTDIDDADVEDVNEKNLSTPQAETSNVASNSDSETDIEDEQLKTSKKRPKAIASDSDTDIEDEALHNLNLAQSEDIVRPKRLSRKSVLNSDSETDDKKPNSAAVADEDADSNATEILNDTDCIPATQDAFADMFQYKKLVKGSANSQNLSSEESFKLGLTELMVDGEISVAEEVTIGEGDCVTSNVDKKAEDTSVMSEEQRNGNVECVQMDEDNNLKITQKLESNNGDYSTNVDGLCLEAPKQVEDEASTNIGKDAEDIYMMPTQKINEELVTKKISPPSSVPSTSKIVNIEEEADEDFYLMPTQKINEVPVSKNTTQPSSISSSTKVNDTEKEADEDFYVMPTQKIDDSEHEFKAPAKRFTFKKKTTNLEGSLTNILSTKEVEDPYLEATQKLNETEDDNEDDVYMQPTQKLENNTENAVKSQSNDDIYMQPTQDLNPSGPSISEATLQTEEGFFMAPTQKIDQINALYMAETQKIDSQSDTVPDEIVFVYGLITPPTEPDDEIPYAHEEPIPKSSAMVATNQDSPRRKRMRKADIESLKRTIESKENVNDPETLSQIEAFIKKPSEVARLLKESPGGRKIVVEAQINKADKTEGQPSIETASDVSLPKVQKCMENVSTGEDVDRPETLSQIEAFVKKPLNSKRKTSQYEEIPSTSDTKANETMQQSKVTPRTRQLTKLSEEDAYLVPTQEIKQDSSEDRMNKMDSDAYKEVGATRDTSNAELYMLETQQIDYRPDIFHPDDVPQNTKRSSTSALGREETPTKHLEDVDTPKRKRVKKSDAQDTKKPTDFKEDAKDNDRPETLSQIDAFVKKPLDAVAPKSRKLPKIKEIPVESDQAKDAVKKPGKQQTDEFEKPVIRASRSRQPAKLSGHEKRETTKISTDSNELEVRGVDVDKNASTSSSDPDTVRSDVDQSFALLEAKSTKTRKSNRITGAGEIKVAAITNRRSMTTTSIADFSKIEGIESKPATRKSRKVNNNTAAPVPVTYRSRRTVGKSVPAKRKSDDSDSDFQESELPSKKSKVSVARKGKGKASVAGDSDKVTGEVSDKDASSKTPRASAARRGKGNATVTDDVNKGATTSEESSKTPKVNVAKKGKGKLNDINEASRVSEDSIKEVSSNTPRTSGRRGREWATVVASTGKEESDKVVPSKSKGKSIVKGHADEISAGSSEENDRVKETVTPSTSRVRASSRLATPKNNEGNGSEGGSAYDSSVATPSRRGRKAVPEHSPMLSPERSKRKQRPKVVFTMMDNPQLESLIRQLGGSVVDSVDASTVLVTEHVKRSQKLLTAVGQGKPVCSPNWIQASKKANEFLDPWDFILTDKDAETKWDFSLKESISKAANGKLLVNYSFHLLVNNAVDVLKGAIESCGGRCVTRNPPKNAEGFYVVVSSPENKNKYLKIKKQHPEVIVVEPEAVFDGVLRQDLRLGRHLLT